MNIRERIQSRQVNEDECEGNEEMVDICGLYKKCILKIQTLLKMVFFFFGIGPSFSSAYP